MFLSAPAMVIAIIQAGQSLQRVLEVDDILTEASSLSLEDLVSLEDSGDLRPYAQSIKTYYSHHARTRS